MQSVRLRPSLGTIAPQATLPDVFEEPAFPPDEPPPPGVAESPDSVEQVMPRPASTLRPRFDDPRLWTRAPLPELDRAVAESERLRQRIDEDNSRVLGVGRVPAEDMSTWTTRDASGDRWGLSPGVIHLGGVALPLCSGAFEASSCGFGVPPAFRDQYRAELRALIELQRQGARADLEERARAIRVRLDSLRDTLRSEDQSSEG